MTSAHYLPLGQRRFVVTCIMATAIMNQIDTTIANVALPHMQGSTSATREQISWVLTSYIIALAICTPLTGWMAGRFGRKRVILASIAGFTASSLLCGMAYSLNELVLFRLLQGASGAAMLPLAQAILLDIHPPEEHGKAMSVYTLAAVFGPLIGPVLGGWLTDHFSWHWVFLINLPIGLFCFLGLLAQMPEVDDRESRPFDVFGFTLLALAIGGFQLMMDRGQVQDWFESTEIWIEATIAAAASYLFVVHVLTARQPFVRLAIFKDRNYVITSLIGFFLGVMMYGVLSLLPPMLAGLFDMPITTIGLSLAPRGIGVLMATIGVALIVDKVDARLIVFAGLMASASSSLLLSQMSLQADDWLVIISGVFNGMGTSLIFVPLATIGFATLAPELRNEAAAFNTLIRHIGSAGGISMLSTLTYRNDAVVRSRLTEGVRPDNPILAAQQPGLDFSVGESLSRLNAEIVRQATMVSYVDAFWLLFIVATFASPLVFLMKTKRR